MPKEGFATHEVLSGPRPDYLTPRAILFLFWIVATNEFLSRHLGIGWDAPWMTLALGALGTGFGLLEAATGQNLKTQWLGHWVRRGLQFPVLTALYAILLLIASLYSSVTLLNDPAGSVLEANLLPVNPAAASQANADNRNNPKEPVHFWAVRTGPLGRVYRIAVKGYLPLTVPLYPLAGVTIDPGRDLRPTPSLLLRMPIDALAAIAGGVKFEIFVVQENRRDRIATGTTHGNSILVGLEQPIPPELLGRWRQEAMAQGVVAPQVLAQLLRFWERPDRVAPPRPLEPGRVIEAVVYNPDSQPLARAKTLLTDARFQDTPMEMIVEESR